MLLFGSDAGGATLGKSRRSPKRAGFRNATFSAFTKDTPTVVGQPLRRNSVQCGAGHETTTWEHAASTLSSFRGANRVTDMIDR